MLVREPAVAGMFYQARRDACEREVGELFDRAADALGSPDAPALPERIVGGIVPHAGYVFSGEVAARTLEAVAVRRDPAVFVILGAMHRPRGGEGLLFDRGVWQTPLGEVAVDERLAARLLDSTNQINADADSHADEHSIEVQLPLLKYRFDRARILPILVPPTPQAVQVGQAVGRTLEMFDVDAVVLASTDLTHYGPRYRFTPQGVGAEGLRWAKEQNDAGVIDAICRLDPEAVVAESGRRHSACGGGAVAAALAASRRLGATEGVVLEHTTSYEVAGELFGEQPSDAVGYLSAVLG